MDLKQVPGRAGSVSTCHSSASRRPSWHRGALLAPARRGVVAATSLALLTALVPVQPLRADELRGSHASLDRQNRVARQHDFTYIDTPARVRHFAAKGWLVRVNANRDVRLSGVSFPYARPEVKLFVERLGQQYRAACGDQLVVTSLTRPTTRQPRNASDRSVHPTGMALDLRYSRNYRCRRWLEDVLLSLEGAGVLEATKERRPIHYHVALFPRQYASYVRSLDGATPEPARPTPGGPTYTVRRGDSLWTIAQAQGMTVQDLRELNDLSHSRIQVGQELRIQGAPEPVVAAAPDEATTDDASAASSDVTPASEEPQAEPALAEAVSDSDTEATQAEATQAEVKAAAYQVRPGDSLWTIAQSYGMSVRELRRANDMRGSRIHPGQVLQIQPASLTGGQDAPLEEAVAYRVRSGDSLWTIARSHGLSVRELRRANDMRGSRIHPGQVLQIPQGS